MGSTHIGLALGLVIPRSAQLVSAHLPLLRVKVHEIKQGSSSDYCQGARSRLLHPAEVTIQARLLAALSTPDIPFKTSPKVVASTKTTEMPRANNCWAIPVCMVAGNHVLTSGWSPLYVDYREKRGPRIRSSALPSLVPSQKAGQLPTTIRVQPWAASG